MIQYRYEEERVVALFFADVLNDQVAKEVLTRGQVSSREEAIHLSKFFWRMVDKSAEGVTGLPCEGSSQYWTEKLYDSIGAYLVNAGYASEWNEEMDRA